MAARFRVQTNDLTLRFFEKSFTVAGQCIYTGRHINREEGGKIAGIMQTLVNQGRGYSLNNRQCETDTLTTITDEHLFTENEELKDNTEDLKQEVLDLKQTIDWYQFDAIQGGS